MAVRPDFAFFDRLVLKQGLMSWRVSPRIFFMFVEYCGKKSAGTKKAVFLNALKNT